MSNPTELKYTAEHEWLREDGDLATVGITAFAAEKLGDIVYIELPRVGTQVTAGSIVGEIESTKSVGELYSPVSGEIIEANEAVVASPELVNNDPFGAGWLVKVRVTSLGETMDSAAYDALTGE
jgi:glycine cleavage system H protein